MADSLLDKRGRGARLKSYRRLVAAAEEGMMVMHHSWLHRSASIPRVEAAELLLALEILHAELGGVAEELILVLRNAGIRRPGEPEGPTPLLH